MYPLVLFAQKRLCSLASTLLSRRETRLVEIDEQFQAAQAKRRRRKVGWTSFVYLPLVLV